MSLIKPPFHHALPKPASPDAVSLRTINSEPSKDSNSKQALTPASSDYAGHVTLWRSWFPSFWFAGLCASRSPVLCSSNRTQSAVYCWVLNVVYLVLLYNKIFSSLSCVSGDRVLFTVYPVSLVPFGYSVRDSYLMTMLVYQLVCKPSRFVLFMPVV